MGYRVAARALALFPLVLTALPLIKTGRGWIRIWDFPRLQIAGLAALGGIALRASNRDRTRTDRWLEAGLLAAVGYQTKKILPYTRLVPKQVVRARNANSDTKIKLLISNVLQTNRDYQTTLDIIESAQADIVCLLETDHGWEEAMRPIEETYPEHLKCPLDNTYGMLLYSRLPLENPEVRFLVESDIPSMRATVPLRSGERIELYCLHPRPPLPDHPSYGRDAELVLVGREIEESRKPSIVIGDLNDVAWSYTTRLFRRVSQTLDPRVGRGLYNSFDATSKWLRYPLDHVFHTREFALVDLQRLRFSGSDHFPICVELAYVPAVAPIQEPSQLSPTDHEEAHDILKDAVEEGVADGEALNGDGLNTEVLNIDPQHADKLELDLTDSNAEDSKPASDKS
jgi:endonuclease/exonuclease/phosphatase (EEP) superfamily protein YafD